MRPEIQRLVVEKERLQQAIADLENQLSGLKGELSGIQRAMALVSGTEPEVVTATPKRERARNVKETVLGVVQASSPDGINVNQLLERAAREGNHLERGTVSSLLSRFKREGVLDMKDGKYFIPAVQPSEPRMFN
jgi:cell division septum initiation protein DivIVA